MIQKILDYGHSVGILGKGGEVSQKSIITLEKKWRGRFNNLHPTTIRSSKKKKLHTRLFKIALFLDFIVRADNLENNQKKTPKSYKIDQGYIICT